MCVNISQMLQSWVFAIFCGCCKAECLHFNSEPPTQHWCNLHIGNCEKGVHNGLELHLWKNAHFQNKLFAAFAKGNGERQMCRQTTWWNTQLQKLQMWHAVPGKLCFWCHHIEKMFQTVAKRHFWPSIGLNSNEGCGWRFELSFNCKRHTAETLFATQPIQTTRVCPHTGERRNVDQTPANYFDTLALKLATVVWKINCCSS